MKFGSRRHIFQDMNQALQILFGRTPSQEFGTPG